MVLLLTIALTGLAQPRFLRSPEIKDDGTVSFRYAGANASSVVLSAEFLEERIPLEKVDSALWTVQVGPFEPDIYPYYFIVNGVSIADPSNTLYFPNEKFKSKFRFGVL